MEAICLVKARRIKGEKSDNEHAKEDIWGMKDSHDKK